MTLYSLHHEIKRFDWLGLGSYVRILLVLQLGWGTTTLVKPIKSLYLMTQTTLNHEISTERFIIKFINFVAFLEKNNAWKFL